MAVPTPVPVPLAAFKPVKRARTLRCTLLAAALAASWAWQAGPALAQGAPKVRIVTGNGDFLVDVRPAAAGPAGRQKPASAEEVQASPDVPTAALATAPTPEPALSPALSPAPEPALSLAQPAPDAPATSALTPAVGAASGPEEAVEQVVRTWANAWAGKDLKVYFASYGQGFAPPGNQARKDWAESRRARITGKSRISVKLSGLAIAVRGSQATARFKQHYSADALNISSQKTLELTKEADQRWVIVRETTGS
jgi:ketosteroid isomerase-like protein